MSGKVFISYHAEDEVWKKALVTQLRVLQIDCWEKSLIGLGEETTTAIQQAIAQCNVAVLLISAPFLADPDIRQTELTWLLERQQQNQSPFRLIPLLVRPCPLPPGSWLEPIHHRPQGGRSLSLLDVDEAEAALAELVKEIYSHFSPDAYPKPIQIRQGVNPAIDYLRCDRESQQMDFNKSFLRWFKNSRNKLQFHIVHGREEDCPDSLVERLWRIELDTAIKTLSRTELADLIECQPKNISIELPSSENNLDETGISKLYERLIKGLFERLFVEYIDEFYMSDSPDWPGIFARLCKEAKCLPPVIAIEHSVRHWNAATQQLLSRYQKFWVEVQTRTQQPQFLIFLHITYPDEPVTQKFLGLFRKTRGVDQVCENLTQFSKALSGSGFQSQVLEKLTEISVEEVMQWADDCGYKRRDRSLEKRIRDELFHGRQHLPMNEVEEWLAAVCQKYAEEL